MNPNYCPDLFTNLFVQKFNATHAELAYCCISERTVPTDKIDFFHKKLEDGRQHFLSTGELPKDCQVCVDCENNGTISRRLAELSYEHRPYTFDREVLRLQYNCDNICNLKCIGCGGWYSSAWIEDEIKLGSLGRINPATLKIKPTKHNSIILDLDVSKVHSVYFNGGEPLMTKDHLRVLQYLIENGKPSNQIPKDIYITYNTNATHPLTDEMFTLWKQFASVHLMASIDGIHDSFEYIRFPANWNKVVENINNYRNAGIPNLSVSFGINIGVHNVMYYKELEQFCFDNNIKLTYQHDTQGVLSLVNLPKHLVPTVLEYLETLPQTETKEILMNCVSKIQQPNVLAWVNWLSKLDSIRGNNWKKSLHRLYDLDPNYFDSIKIL
jgi:sulfatase maturation enzyme AslB (radical SAM superfamily)